MKINKYNRCTVKSWKQNQKKNYNRIKREKMNNENNQDKPKYLLENLDKSSIPLNNHFSGVLFYFVLCLCGAFWIYLNIMALNHDGDNV